MKKFWSQYQVLIILVIALLLRLPLLSGSFWLDEAAQALESIRPLSEQLKIVQDFQPPLLHYLVHFASYISIDEWWLRLWGALIPGLITIWAAYQLGKKLFNKKVALIASLLLATSSFHIFYSQELRPYSLPAMWAMLSTLLLFKKDFSWWKFALVSALGLYSSYLYPFFLLPQLWLVWQLKWGWQRVLKICVSIGVLFLPWLPTFLQQLAAGQNLRQLLPGWEIVVSTPQAKALFLVPLKFIYGVLNIDPNLYFIVPTALLLVFAFIAWRPNVKSLFDLKKPAAQLAILLLAPLLLSWLVSFVIPVVQPKRLLYLLPFLYLLIALPFGQQKKAGAAALGLVALVLVINLYSLWQYWTNPWLQRENWRGLQTEIASTFPVSDTLVVFVFDEVFSPWRWYQPDAMATLSIDPTQMKSDDSLRTALKPTINYRYILVFDYLRDLTDPENKLLPAIENLGFTGRGVIDYPNLGFVRIYTRPDYAIGYSL